MKSLSRLAVCLLAVCAFSFSLRAAEAKRYNVLFIAVDDLRPEFGVYGSKIVKSPNLDALAAKGLTFNRAYCQQAVCSPSRSSLLTGTRPDTTKVWDLETHFRKALPDVVTLPQHFKNNGYFVQGMGKLYHGGFDDPQSWSTPWTNPKAKTYGLQVNNEMAGKKAAEAKDEDDNGAKKGKKGKKAKSTAPNSRGPAFEGADVPDNAFHDGALADMAISALRELKDKKQPFWLGVGFIRPHLPFVSPKKYWDLYDPKQIELATFTEKPKGAPSYAIVPGGELRSYDSIPTGHVPDDLARQLKHGYYAAISYMDAQLGKVIAELDRLGLRDDTIIILWGDHGWKLGEYDAWCKHTNVELDTHAPLIISVPGQKTAGKHTDALVEFVDIYPSLAELCGLPKPGHLEGTSFAPLVKNPDMTWKQAAFSQYPRSALMGYSMRTDRYRFTRWVNRKDHSQVDAVELYDHQKDPMETVNIAIDPKNAKLVETLTEQWTKGWKAAQLNGK